jgi:hypothetical protein
LITTRSIRTSLLTFVGAAAIVAGCSSPAASVAPSTSAVASPNSAGIEGTTGRIVDSAKGFAVTLPDGWTRLDVDAAAVENMLEAGSKNLTPEAREALKQQLATLASAGITFYAIAPTSAPGFTTNLNIIAGPAEMTLDEIETGSLAQVEEMGVARDAIENERVTVPAGEALHLRYSLPAKAADGGQVEATIEQYTVVADGKQYILTFTGVDDGSLGAAAQATAESLEIQD